MFYPNKSSILVSGEGNSSRSKTISFMRILNLERILFLMCIVSSGEITLGMEDYEAVLKKEIKVEKLENNSEEEYDLNYKVVFLGDTKVGKTQILNKHVNGSFDAQSISTIGCWLMSKDYNRTTNEGNKIIRLQIWDTPGDKTYRSLVPINIKTAQAIVLVYDVTNAESFNNIKDNWLSLATQNNIEDAAYFLVGNKTDLKNNRGVPADKAKKYAEDNNMQFFEVSAMKGDNLDELFKDIVKEFFIKDKIKEAISDDELEDNTNNDNNTNNNDESKVDEEGINPLTQSTTQTKNKPCICCSCCPCNKENKK